MLEAKTGRKWYSHFSQEYGQWTSPGKGHQVLSVYPFDAIGHTTITSSSGLKGAGAASQATITVNGRALNFIVGHLDPYDATMRLTQAKEVLAYAEGFAENRILAGDMPRYCKNPEIRTRWLTRLRTLAAAERNEEEPIEAVLAPEVPDSTGGTESDEPRQVLLADLLAGVASARAYRTARSAASDRHETDSRMEAMIPVLDKRIPVLVVGDEDPRRHAARVENR